MGTRELRRLLPVLCFSVLGTVAAVEYYDVGSARGIVLEVVGTTRAQGLEDGLAAVAKDDFRVVVVHSLQPETPVLCRDGQTGFLARPFTACFRLPHLSLDCHYFYKIVESGEGRDRDLGLDYVLESFDPIPRPGNAELRSVCTMDYAAAYNSLVVNYLLLHPDKLEQFRFRRPSGRTEKSSVVMEALPVDQETLNRLQEKMPDEWTEEEAAAFAANERNRLIEAVRDAPPPVDCGAPIRIEDVDVLPLGDFLARHLPDVPAAP